MKYATPRRLTFFSRYMMPSPSMNWIRSFTVTFPGSVCLMSRDTNGTQYHFRSLRASLILHRERGFHRAVLGYDNCRECSFPQRKARRFNNLSRRRRGEFEIDNSLCQPIPRPLRIVANCSNIRVNSTGLSSQLGIQTFAVRPMIAPPATARLILQLARQTAEPQASVRTSQVLPQDSGRAPLGQRKLLTILNAWHWENPLA